MIKYETTIEEAKKIKELGYDFSFACRKFYSFADKKYYYFDENHGDILTTDRFWLDGDIETFAEIIEYHGFIDTYDFVPIIPYPILEACLPAVRTKAPFNGFVDSSIRALFFGTYQMIDEQIDDYSCLDDYILNDFENAYEAFIWCAENYPDKTREKFQELKKEYE